MPAAQAPGLAIASSSGPQWGACCPHAVLGSPPRAGCGCLPGLVLPGPVMPAGAGGPGYWTRVRTTGCLTPLSGKGPPGVGGVPRVLAPPEPEAVFPGPPKRKRTRRCGEKDSGKDERRGAVKNSPGLPPLAAGLMAARGAHRGLWSSKDPVSVKSKTRDGKSGNRVQGETCEKWDCALPILSLKEGGSLKPNCRPTQNRPSLIRGWPGDAGLKRKVTQNQISPASRWKASTGG